MFTETTDKGLQNPALAQGIPATLQFRYSFAAPFTRMSEAFMKKYNWEAPTRLTTIEKVE